MAKNYPKKKFFREPTKSEIIENIGNFISMGSNFFPENIVYNKNLGLIVERILIPKEFTHRKFKKHGEEIEIRYDENPFQSRRKTLNNLDKDKIYSHLSFTPLQGRDKRKRIITPIGGAESAKIIYYSYHTYPEQFENLSFIKILKPYDNVERADIDGIIALVEVPSRTVKSGPYKIRLEHFPIKNNKNKIAIASTIGSTHYCKESQYFFGYGKKDGEEFNVKYLDEHIQSAYWMLARYYKRGIERGKRTEIPMEMSPFLFPTQFGIDIYKLMTNRTLIRDEKLETKNKLRKLDKAEKNALFFEAVKQYNHDPIFYNKGVMAEGDERLQYCNWD